MGESPEHECAICYETIEPFQVRAVPRECSHAYHSVCLNRWLTENRSCPLCRKKISLESQIPWRTLFAFSLVWTQEMMRERAAMTFCFLSLLLKRYQTSASWNERRNEIIEALEKCHLPYVDLRTRSAAVREQRRWRQLCQEILEKESVQLKYHPRILVYEKSLTQGNLFTLLLEDRFREFS